MLKYSIVRLGCPKNDADMDIFRGLMENSGYIYSENQNELDYIIIDTCGFKEDAKEESINTIFECLNIKKTNNKLKVIAIGCLIQRYYNEIKKEIPELDGLIGVTSPEKVLRCLKENNLFYFPAKPKDIYKCSYRYVPETAYAYVKISDGCNRNCSFCSIPYFKGSPVSRDIEDIKKEVEYLVKNGIKEIILVSQDNTLYGLDNYNKQALPELLDKLDEIDYNFWVRVMYLHPDFLDQRIIQAIHNSKKTINYFDIPIQHSSNKILKSMKRKKTKKDLITIIELIRKQPSFIRSTFIVGYPGEEIEDFNNLIDFMELINFDRLGVFTYSHEEGTPAYELIDNISSEEKSLRMQEIMAIQNEISERNLNSYIGKTLKILIEEKEDNVYIGRSELDAPDIDGNVFVKTNKSLKLNEFYSVKIVSNYDYDLEGELI